MKHYIRTCVYYTIAFNYINFYSIPNEFYHRGITRYRDTIIVQYELNGPSLMSNRLFFIQFTIIEVTGIKRDSITAGHFGLLFNRTIDGNRFDTRYSIFGSLILFSFFGYIYSRWINGYPGACFKNDARVKHNIRKYRTSCHIIIRYS